MTPQTNGAGAVARLLSYVLFLILSGVLFFDARELPTTRWEVLGAGAFPQIVFAVLAGLCALAFIDEVRRLPDGAIAAFFPAAVQWCRVNHLVIAMFALLAIYLIALPIVGFSWATFAFLIVVQALLSPRTPRALLIALAIAVIFSFGLNALFAEVFNVFLPRAGI